MTNKEQVILRTVTQTQMDYKTITEEDEDKINSFLDDVFKQQNECPANHILKGRKKSILVKKQVQFQPSNVSETSN